MVGGRSREPRPQYCRPGEPAIANHQTHHEVNKELSLRLGGFWCKEPKSQNTEGDRERKIVAGVFGGTPPVLSRPGVRRAQATASIGKSTTISLCPEP